MVSEEDGLEFMIEKQINRILATVSDLLAPVGMTGPSNRRISERRWPEMQNALPFLFLIAALGLAMNLFPG